MRYRIQAIDGIGPVHASKLLEAGITTTSAFLKCCRCPKGREALSRKTTISTHLLFKWAKSADLIRISGICLQFTRLLKATGVNTASELKRYKPEDLAAKMAKINARRRICRLSPGTSLVSQWIAKARIAGPAIRH